MLHLLEEKVSGFDVFGALLSLLLSFSALHDFGQFVVGLLYGYGGNGGWLGVVWDVEFGEVWDCLGVELVL